MDIENEQYNLDLDRIASYIKKLKFKKAVMGGIEQDSAYKAMRELVSIFTDIYTSVTERNSQLEQQLQQMQDEHDTTESRIQMLKEQTAQHVEKLKDETERQNRKMEAENKTLKEQLRKESQSHSGEFESLQAANADLSSQVQALSAQNEALSTQNEALSAKLQELQEHASESEFQRETLEEIYLDANRRRLQILDAANTEAKKLRQDADEENAKLKQAFDAKMKAWRTGFEQEQKRLEDDRQAATEQFNRDLAQSKAQMSAEEKVCQEHCEALINEAEEKALAIMADTETESEQILAQAKADAEKRKAETDAMVVSAQIKYKTERARYDGMIRRLGEMRTEILRSIQKDVNQLQTLAFHISGSGIESETDCITGIDALNEIQKAAENAVNN